MIEDGKYDDFWRFIFDKINSRPGYNSILSDNAKELFLGMIHPNSNDRLSIEGILNHAWLSSDGIASDNDV